MGTDGRYSSGTGESKADWVLDGELHPQGSPGSHRIVAVLLPRRRPAQQPGIPAAGPGDGRLAKRAARLRYAPPTTQLGRGTGKALTFDLDRSLGAGQQVREGITGGVRLGSDVGASDLVTSGQHPCCEEIMAVVANGLRSAGWTLFNLLQEHLPVSTSRGTATCLRIAQRRTLCRHDRAHGVCAECSRWITRGVSEERPLRCLRPLPARP